MQRKTWIYIGISLALMLLMASSLSLSADRSQSYSIGWSSLGTGSTAVSGESFSLTGGSQATQTTSLGDSYSLTSGFYAGTRVAYTLYLPAVSAD